VPVDPDVVAASGAVEEAVERWQGLLGLDQLKAWRGAEGGARRGALAELQIRRSWAAHHGRSVELPEPDRRSDLRVDPVIYWYMVWSVRLFLSWAALSLAKPPEIG